MDVFAFSVSAFVAHVLTNLDNLAIMVGMIFTLGRLRTTVGYLIAQLVMLSAAMALAVGAVSEMPQMVGYFGVVPLTLGLVALWRSWRDDGDVDPHRTGQMRLLAVVALFLSVSFDSFAVLAPLLAESELVYRRAALSGAAIASVVMAGAGLGLTKLTPMAADRTARLEQLAPYVMITVGLYVLLNTATDKI